MFLNLHMCVFFELASLLVMKLFGIASLSLKHVFYSANKDVTAFGGAMLQMEVAHELKIEAAAPYPR